MCESRLLISFESVVSKCCRQHLFSLRRIPDIFMKRLFAVIVLIVNFTLSAETIEWSGEKVVSSPIKFEWGRNLKIIPGTTVKFTQNGQIISKNVEILAENACFTADAPLSGKSRFQLSGGKIAFISCRFENLVAKDKKFHDAFCAIRCDNCVIKDNVFRNCSALELMLSNKPEVSWNVFDSCAKALVMFHTRYALVKNNTFRDCPIESLRLNSAENSLIMENRFYNPQTAILIYRKSMDNIICANSVFDGDTALCLWELPRRNLIARLYTDKTKVGIVLKNNGPDNIITDFSFNNGKRKVQERGANRFPVEIKTE